MASSGSGTPGRRGGGFATPRTPSSASRPRRSAKGLEETALEEIHAFYITISDHIDSITPDELHQAQLLLGNLAATQPPNFPTNWKQHIVKTLREANSAYHEFFAHEGKCWLWPNGLKNGAKPSRHIPFPQSGSSSSGVSKEENSSPSPSPVSIRSLNHAPSNQRHRRPPLPAADSGEPLWKLQRGNRILVMYQYPVVHYGVLPFNDPIVATIATDLSVPNTEPPVLPTILPSFLDRTRAIIDSRKSIDPETQSAKRHLDSGPHQMALVINYLRILDSCLYDQKLKDSRILISCHKDSLPAWIATARQEWPLCRPVWLSAEEDEVKLAREFKLLTVADYADVRLPIVYFCCDDSSSFPDASTTIFDTIIVDGIDRIDLARSSSPLRLHAFHHVALAHQSSPALHSEFQSNYNVPNVERHAIQTAAGGSLRVSFAFVSLGPEADAYRSLAEALDIGLDRTKKLKDLHSLLYTSTIEDSLGSILTAACKLAFAIVTSPPPDTRVLIVVRSNVVADAITTAMENYIPAPAVLYLNGSTAGTNYRALENVDPAQRVIVATKAVAERQLANLHKFVDTLIFVEAPVSPCILSDLMTASQQRQCLAIALEPATGYGLRHLDKVLEEIDPTAPKPETKKLNAPFTFKSVRHENIGFSNKDELTDATVNLLLRAPPRSVLDAAKQATSPHVEIKNDPSSVAISSSQSTVSSSQTVAVVAHDHQKLTISSESASATLRFTEFKKRSLQVENEQRLERLKNRKKRPAPGDPDYPPAKRLKSSFSISAERFTSEHLSSRNWNSAALINLQQSDRRQMLVLISLDAEAAPKDLIGSGGHDWIKKLLLEINPSVDYEIVASNSARQRNNSTQFLFVVLLLPRDQLTTREAWLTTTNPKFVHLSEEQLVVLSSMFEIEIECNVSEREISFGNYSDDELNEGDDEMDDVQFDADLSSFVDSSRASTSGSVVIVRKSISPSRQPRRRTRAEERDELDDISDGHTPYSSPVRSPARSPVRKGRNLDAMDLDEEVLPAAAAAVPVASSSSSSSSAVAAVTAPAPAPAVAQPSQLVESHQNAVVSVSNCLRQATQSSEERLKLVKILLAIDFVISVSERSSIVSMFFDSGDVETALKASETLSNTERAAPAMSVSATLMSMCPSEVATWILFVTFAKALGLAISPEDKKTLTAAAWKLAPTQQDILPLLNQLSKALRD